MTLADSMLQGKLMEQVAAFLEASSENNREQLDGDRKTREVIEEKIRNLIHLAEEGHASGKIKERLSELEMELAAVSERIERVEAAARPIKMESATLAVAQFSRDFCAKCDSVRPEFQNNPLILRVSTKLMLLEEMGVGV